MHITHRERQDLFRVSRCNFLSSLPMHRGNTVFSSNHMVIHISFVFTKDSEHRQIISEIPNLHRSYPSHIKYANYEKCPIISVGDCRATDLKDEQVSVEKKRTEQRLSVRQLSRSYTGTVSHPHLTSNLVHGTKDLRNFRKRTTSFIQYRYNESLVHYK